MKRNYDWMRINYTTTIVIFLFLMTNAQEPIIISIAGGGTNGMGDGGSADSADVNAGSIAIDVSSNVYFADIGYNRVRKIDAATGVINSIAGNGTQGYAGDGGPADSAEFSSLGGIAVDNNGNVYITDMYNNRIRKVNALTHIITTVAGNGSEGYSGDGGPADSAALFNPMGVAVDKSGNLYIADWKNQRIRKVNAATGIISTITGNGIPTSKGYGGPADSAGINYPSAVAVDPIGNVFIAEYGGERIDKIDVVTGILSVAAGNGYSGSGSGGYSGDDGQADSAELSLPTGVCIGNNNNIYIADDGNLRIRKVDATTDIITTLAGNGYGFPFQAINSGDGGLADSAGFSNCWGVAVDMENNVYVAADKRVRKIIISPTAVNNVKLDNGILLYPNPANENLYISFGNKLDSYKIQVSNLSGTVLSEIVNNGENIQTLNISDFASGIYFIKLQNENGEIVRKFVKF